MNCANWALSSVLTHSPQLYIYCQCLVKFDSQTSGLSRSGFQGNGYKQVLVTSQIVL